MVYGLAFFLMGFAIALQPKNFSNIPLAKSLKFLALFGIAHGLVEWGIMFIPFQREYLYLDGINNIIVFKTFLNSLSFMFLFMFGSSLLSETKQRWNGIHYIPVVIFGMWFMLFILSNIFYYDDFRTWINSSNAWSRYLLALPGSIISAYAIYLQIPLLKQRRFKVSSSKLQGFSAAFLLYAFAGGLIVPETTFLPASVINTKSFFELTGIPIYLIRATSGVLMAYYAVLILRIFKIEIERQLEQAQILNSVYNERERFSRDLHDGIIQSVYGVGLYLENASMSMDKEPEKSKSHIKTAIEKLDDVIIQMRNYINNLRAQSSNNTNILINSIFEIIHDFKIHSKINVDFAYDEAFNKFYPSGDVTQNIKLITFELLTNVIKHAQASNVKIKLKSNNNIITLIISDNGKGFNERNLKKRTSQGYHQGLNNIKERVYSLKGSLSINSKPKQGTTIEIEIPWEDDLDD
ncbi:sensor histidine kinase [Desulfuribacillus alkaliarsenatis]|uniref:histidine kinase n=1 Tax=Desulfuribacillus alkaliarsenatis TaxID=766136 RepID=A0A1E5G550_9FIRM|nr:sensor histidine kinase [Desulfuribacillus alkaliarsenatis]OEF98301.1 hypothetical protein BHF68_01065 [Desulfuribacillus alkaliarsenatis]